jgi:beta-glucosidase
MFKNENECRLSEEELETKVADLMARMTLKEKVWLLNGNWDVVGNRLFHKNDYNPVPIKTNGLKRLGIPDIRFSDGPRGIVMGHSTCFPVSMARGAAFDLDLERRIGEAIGIEARCGGANFFGGVCINLLRHPAWGRAQETYGEDPFHVGEMGKALTQGVQRHNVMACVKHYAVNNIENSRFFVNVKADGRTMREVYLPHFKKSIDAGAASVMGSYNKYGGDHACESTELLTDILRGEWGFEGFVISDFLLGVRETRKAINAGLDVEMPMPDQYQKDLLDAVTAGEVPEALIDRSVSRVVKTVLAFENSRDPMTYSRDLIACKKHTALAREAAEQSMVLIKNDGVLPFDRGAKRVAVFGKLANQANTGDHGSSRVYPPYVVTQLDGFRDYFGKDAEVIYHDGTNLDSARELAATVDAVVIIAGCDFNDEGEYVSSQGEDNVFAPVLKGFQRQGQPLRHFLMKLMMKRQAAEYTGDDGKPVGGDRGSLSLTEAEVALIKAVAPANPNTVVALVGGSMLMTREWDNDVPAILYAWYSGMEGGHALPRILFGDICPSGKLPFSIPHDVAHLPYFSSTDREITYDLYHGYSLLDKNGTKPAYPYGFGLSYTTFAQGGVAATAAPDGVSVTATVTNTGVRTGAEVVQVYVGMDDSKIDRQLKLLKGFQKVLLDAGESRQVTVHIPLDELRYYSNESREWILEHGTYRFSVASSSDLSEGLQATLVL